MDNFNYKQFLFENKIGVYAKAANLKEDTFYAPSYVAQKYGDRAKEIEANIEDEEEANPNIWDLYTSLQTPEETDEFIKGFINETGDHGNLITTDIPEYEMVILGKEYLIKGSAEVEFTYEDDEYEDHHLIYSGGYVVEKATISISELSVEDGDSYRPIKDPKFIKQIEDLINTDPKLKNQFEEDCAEFLVKWDRLD